MGREDGNGSSWPQTYGNGVGSSLDGDGRGGGGGWGGLLDLVGNGLGNGYTEEYNKEVREEGCGSWR